MVSLLSRGHFENLWGRIKVGIPSLVVMDRASTRTTGHNDRGCGASTASADPGSRDRDWQTGAGCRCHIETAIVGRIGRRRGNDRDGLGDRYLTKPV